MTGALRKSVLGLVVALIFFSALEGIFLLAGVTPVSDRTDPYLGFAGYSPLFVEGTTPAGEPVFRTADAKFDWFNRQIFPVVKATGVRRVFCLGGSTTYGRPYDDATSFCGWLREFLPAADPSRRWEVVNAGGISYASYRVVRVMEELAGHEPDLFIVYTGHNEFLERRTYGRLLDTPEFMRDVGALASGLRLYRVLSDALYPPRDVLDSKIDNILDESIGPEDYHRDDAMRDAVFEHFRLSLERMTRIAAESGAEVLFVTPASNLRDFSPFKAETGEPLDPVARAEFEGLREAVVAHLAKQEYDQAIARADQALAIDARDARLLYLDGRALLAAGRTDEARRAFVSARDEDVAPLRAPSPLAGIVREVARENSKGLVDFAAMTDALAPDGIPGDELFLDHVHPSIDAHRRLALAILDEMFERGIATEAVSWNDAVVADVTERVEAGIDEAAHARALANVARVLSWAGKQDEALRLSARATSVTRDPHTLYQRITVLMRNGRLDEALLRSEEAVRLMPDIADVRKLRGVLLSEKGRSAEALAELEIAARLDPSLAEIRYHLGVVLSDLGLWDRAEEAYRAAIEREPGHADALNNLGILRARRGDVAGALELFERAVGVAPEHPDASRNLERARRMMGG